MKFRGTFKALPCLDRFLLIQLGASQSVESFRTRWIIAKSQTEEGFGLIEVASLKKHRAVGEIVAAELVHFVDTGKRQR